MARSEYKGIRVAQRQRQQRVAAFVALVLVAIFSLGILTSCGAVGGSYVPLDPRDAEAVEAFENSCDRNSSMVTLKVVNQSTFSVLISLVRGSGGGRDLRPAAAGLKTTRVRVSRMELTSSGGYMILRATGGGLSSGGDAKVWISSMIQCDVGTLTIAPVLSMSMYAGADL